MLIADTKTNWSVIHSVTSNSLQPHGLEFSRLPYPQKSPGKNTGVDIHSFLQGIFPTQDQTWISCIVLYHLKVHMEEIFGIYLMSYCICQFFFGVHFWYRGIPWWFRWWRICLQCRRPRFHPWVGKTPRRREWLPSTVFLPGEFHEQRSLAGYSPWGRRVVHDWVTITFTFSY